MTTNFGLLLVVAAAVAAGPVQAGAIYRCEKGGRISFSDLPCAQPLPDAVPTDAADPRPLPPLVPMTPTTRGEQSLATQFDQAATRSEQRKQQENEVWLKDYRQKKAQDEAIRRGLMKHVVVKGMTRDQVERVLNLPSRVDGRGESRERWIYVEAHGRKRTITFENGIVVADKRHSGKS